jgi:hypothetical protein
MESSASRHETISSMLRQHSGQMLFWSSEHFSTHGDLTSPFSSLLVFFIFSHLQVQKSQVLFFGVRLSLAPDY